MQMFKITPAISTSWALLISVNALAKSHEIYKKDILKSQGKENKVFKQLSDVHMHACGMKALSTALVEMFGEYMKQSCGGHGYLMASGLTKPHQNYGFGVATAEGDATVLL